MARIAKKEKSDGLYQAILTLRTEEEVYSFFQDLCTVTELRAMEQRFEVAALLQKGSRQGLQAFFPGNRGAGASLLLVGPV